MIVCALCDRERTVGPFCLHCGGVETKSVAAPSHETVAPKPFVSSVRTTPAPIPSGVSTTAVSPTNSDGPPGLSRDAAPVPQPLPPPLRGGVGRGVIIAVAAAVTVIVGSAIAAGTRNSNHANGAAASQLTQPAPPSGSDPTSATSDSVVTPTASSPPAKPVDPQAVALAELRSIHVRDLAGVTFDGQWVAQLASKNAGITDPLQTTASGSHTFKNSDILAEYRRASDNPDFGSLVLLLQSTDYGKRQLYHRLALWVTVAALPSFGSAQDVTDWCAQEFSQLSPSVLLDSCVPRQLNPPS